jgi:hypothetical protein
MNELVLQPWRRFGDLLLSLLQHRNGPVDRISEFDCGSRTTTQMSCHHNVDSNSLAFRQERICSQFDLNSAIVRSECRYPIEINERSKLGASRGILILGPSGAGLGLSVMMVPIPAGDGTRQNVAGCKLKPQSVSCTALRPRD